MNENENDRELSELLADEVHRLDLRIDDIEDILHPSSPSRGDTKGATKGATRAVGGEYDDDIAELHEEIHEVAEVVDTHTIQINDLDSSLGILTANYENKCAELDAEDLSLQNQITEMDEEHHEELHMLANAIDGCITRIETAENTVNSYPKHVVLTMPEYDAMISRDSNTFYYIYES